MKRIEVDDEIVLRVPEVSDAASFFSLIDRNRDHLGQWLDFVPDTTGVEVTRGVIERWQVAADEESGFNYVIEYRGSIAGSCGAIRLKEPENLAEVGYWLSADLQGRGIITRCCRSMLRLLFEQRVVNRVEISAAKPNRKSRAVPERLGFTFEGYLRDCTFIRGRYFDTAVYSLLAREYEGT